MYTHTHNNMCTHAPVFVSMCVFYGTVCACQLVQIIVYVCGKIGSIKHNTRHIIFSLKDLELICQIQ